MTHNQPKIYSFYVVVHIDKPIPSDKDYGYDMVGVWDKWINLAPKTKRWLVIQTDKGESIYNPKYIKHTLKTYNQVMNIPTNPMKLYALKVEHREKSPDERWEVEPEVKYG
jgi:hypothetical protein